MYLKKRLLASQRLSSSTNWMVTELRQNEDEIVNNFSFFTIQRTYKSFGNILQNL
jgi:hypothetical protein